MTLEQIEARLNMAISAGVITYSDFEKSAMKVNIPEMTILEIYQHVMNDLIPEENTDAKI